MRLLRFIELLSLMIVSAWVQRHAQTSAILCTNVCTQWLLHFLVDAELIV